MVPITFVHGWGELSERDRLIAMGEFAANGARHLVLGDAMMKLMDGDYFLPRTILKQAEAAGVDFVGAHVPFKEFGDLYAPEERERQQMVARHKLHLLLVDEFGVDNCTFHIGSKYRPEYSVEAHREALFRSLDELLPLAEKLHITICLENLRGPLNTTDDLIFCMEKYRSPYLGVCFDSGHANMKEQGEAYPDSAVRPIWESANLEIRWEKDIVERLKPYMVTCHIHDNSGIRDDHDLPGTGTVNWKRIVDALATAPRLKCIQSEVQTWRYGIPIRTLTENIFCLFGVRPELQN